MNKFVLDDWEDRELKPHILLIYAQYEDYRLAYELNKTGFKFQAMKQHLEMRQKGSCFSFSSFINNSNNELSGIYLLNNQSFESTSNSTFSGLFSERQPMSLTLLSKHKKWPFFIIYDNEVQARLLHNKLPTKIISASQQANFEKLYKNEANTIMNFYHEN